jgi:uncharacterized OB-fold protein
VELRDSFGDVGTLERPRVSRDDGCLVGSRCDACGTASWPSRAVCHRCVSSATRETLLGPEGTLTSYTRVWVPRPGIEAPYTIGEVAVAGGVTVFAHVHGLAEGATVPQPGRVVVGSEDSVPPFWFEPSS